VQFVRRERAQYESQTSQTKSAFFGAMEILEDFVGTFAIVSFLLLAASIILTGWYAIKNLY
jgi:flagellar biosynthesis component FlhA